MRCGRCGNENVDGNRFCGMCGAPLIPTQASAIPTARVPAAPSVTTAKTIVVSDAPAKVESNIPPPVHPKTNQPNNELRNTDLPENDPKQPPTESAFSSQRSSPEPLITGPSFLGLNKPAGDHTHDEHTHDVHGPDEHGQHSSRNLDYLLEDEEEPKRGWSKLLLVVLALALAGGFGYLHWKQGGFAWVNGGKKPAATTPESTPNAPDSGSTTNSANTPSPDTGSTPTNPAQGSAPSPVPPTAEPQAAAPQNAPAQNAPAPEATAQPPVGSAPQNVPATTQPSGNSRSPGSAPHTPQPADTTPEKPPAAAEKPLRPKAEARKPPAAKPAVDPVVEAERYIYGRGVRQDCDRGLHMLKQAAQESNVKAMISLGARYSTGTCAPRDLPTSYRWFALALHKEPDNQALQDDLQKLWGQMTQPERQLAIKLSQ